MQVKVAECPLGAKCEEVKTDAAGEQYIARCPWYTKVAGTDNNTNTEVDHWGCAIAWLPTLLINTANESRKGVAATESFRNEMTKQGAQAQQLMLLQLSSKSYLPLQQGELCE
jgi:hypothetical protein